ncbi:sensor histidine kinase [Novosphingobium nitrogenifigens]|nr:response regulator [Novosphingobium nitrogenifigens]
MPNSGSRILYVDDDPGLCRLAQRKLERMGFVVELAHGGEAALEAIGDRPFDLVALDHYMPGQDGATTLAQLMELPSPPAVVYVTGTQETHVAVQALKAGAADYVVKSTSEDFFDLLGRTINQALDARRLKAEKDRAEQHLRETNAQLEAMLVEMNHRVANSLQMISSLVSLQARRASGEEAQTILMDMRRRIDAVARVHRQLYADGGGGTRICMAAYAHALGRDLTDSFGLDAGRRRIRVLAEPMELPTATAISLGILANELVSNACKYAYADDAEGEVRVRFEPIGSDGYRLTVEDDGAGWDENNAARGTGIGSQMIRAIAEGLGARFCRSNSATGVRAIIEKLPPE